MKIINDTLDFQLSKASAVTLGKFDGIHRGHQKLMNKVLAQKENGLTGVVFTFAKMPGTDIYEKGQTILTGKERQKHLERMGIDVLIECPFVPELSMLEPEIFIEKILVQRLHVKYIAVGSDFRFGYQRKGDCALLKKLSRQFGYEVEVVEKETFDDQVISSTYIRQLLNLGKMEMVQALLGYPYYVSGTVVHGQALGRMIGVPTTNLLPDAEKMLPPNGVYLTGTFLDDRRIWGITNIGVKPTVSGEKLKGIETHLLDFDEDLYGKELTVAFYDFERPEQKFDSLELLKKQLEQDASWGWERAKHYDKQ